MNILTYLNAIFERDLIKLEEEIKAYRNEESIWKTSGDIKNSGGNLCLHLCGNLQHFIGKVLGQIEYQRNREYEFSATFEPREKLIFEIQKTRQAVKVALEKLQESELENLYPIEVFEKPMTTLYFLTHLLAHLGYHLGQINYHRRILQ